MSDDPQLPSLDEAIGPIIPGLSGHDNDLQNILNQAAGVSQERDMPPMHPSDDPANLTELSDEEVEKSMKKKLGNNLFELKHKFRSRYGLFKLSNPEQREELENLVNNCLQKGWILAREEWKSTAEGDMVVSIKCLIPEPKKGKKGKRKKKGN